MKRILLILLISLLALTSCSSDNGKSEEYLEYISYTLDTMTNDTKEESENALYDEELIGVWVPEEESKATFFPAVQFLKDGTMLSFSIYYSGNGKPSVNFNADSYSTDESTGMLTMGEYYDIYNYKIQDGVLDMTYVLEGKYRGFYNETQRLVKSDKTLQEIITEACTWAGEQKNTSNNYVMDY